MLHWRNGLAQHGPNVWVMGSSPIWSSVNINIMDIEHILNAPIEKYNEYLWHMHCNGDIFAEYWRPFTYEEWIRNGMPIYDGGVKLDDGSEHLETFRY